MAITYNKNILGTFKLTQQYWEGSVQIRQGNALAIFIVTVKDPEPKDPSKPWIHHLLNFFIDKSHMNRCLKGTTWENLFFGKIRNIRLNTYFKESQILLQSLTKDGYKVQCYYKEPKNTNHK